MREVLRPVVDVDAPEHLGLAYGAWAPTGAGGKIPDDRRARWLTGLSNLAVSPDYACAFERWKASFRGPADRAFELVLVSRLLVGHGNASTTDGGLTLHHTWGVPMVPGSALKGLLAHYVDALYGPENADLPPWEQPTDAERDRARYQGVTWSGRRVRRGPGEVYRVLFGAPDADEDRVLRERGLEAGAAAGLVVFHDALYVPGSAEGDRPFSSDVLTVHQKSYYDSSGTSWPNDYDSPNPVAFLTVRPRVRILFALSGPADWNELVERLLTEALRDWGVGGKTSSGYGRFVGPDETAVPGAGAGPSRATTDAARPRHQRGDRITVTRVDDPAGKGKVKFRAADGFLGHFAREQPPRVGIGETAEVWVANVSAQGYTLTLRPLRDRKR
jgi:CRISPR-associated protein Cmr6